MREQHLFTTLTNHNNVVHDVGLSTVYHRIYAVPSRISDVRRHVIFSSALGEELNKLTTSVPTLFNLYFNVFLYKSDMLLK